MLTLLALLTGVSQAATQPAFSVSIEPKAIVSVARGASRVPFATLNITAPCDAPEPLVLHSLKIRHEGLGAVSDIEGVYVLDGLLRQSRLHTLDRKLQTAVIRLRPVTIQPCDRKTLVLAGNLASDATAASEHRFIVDEVLGAYGSASLSVMPASMREATPTRVAPVDVEAPLLTPRPLSRRINYGTARTLARFLLSAGKDDLVITAMTFENSGSASDADLQNLRIVNAKGTVLTDVQPSLEGDRVRFTFSPPLSLERSIELLLEIRGDVRSSIRRTVDLRLTEESDIEWETRRRRG